MDAKTLSRFQKVKSLLNSPNAGEAAAARARYDEMISKHGDPELRTMRGRPGIGEVGDPYPTTNSDWGVSVDLWDIFKTSRDRAYENSWLDDTQKRANAAARWIEAVLGHYVQRGHSGPNGLWIVSISGKGKAKKVYEDLTDNQLVEKAIEWGWIGD